MTLLSHLLQRNANILPLLNFLNTSNMKMHPYQCPPSIAIVLLLNISSNGQTFDFTGLTEGFKIQDVLRYRIKVITIYYSTQRLYIDDDHG